MGRFHELIDSVGVGEDGVSVAYPETFIDDIRGAYDEDFAGPTAAITVKDQEISALKQEILELQAHNYQLLMQIPSAPAVDETPEEDNSESDDEDGEGDLDKVFGN